MTYETDLARIEAIVDELERETLPLDRALALFEEGVERLRTANATLAQADGRLRMLSEDRAGGFSLADCD